MFNNTPYAPEAQQLARRRALLDAMTQQAISPQQTQMVSGRVVPYGIGQGLTQLAQALVARKGLEGVREEEKALAGRAAQGRQEAVERVMETMRGRPQTGGPLRGATDYQPVSPAIPPDPMKAAMMAATDPNLQGTGAQGVMSALLQSQLKSSGRGEYFSPVEVTQPDGSVVIKTFDHRTGNIIEPDAPAVSPKYAQDVHKGLSKAKERGQLEAQLELKPKIADALATGEKIRNSAGVGGLVTYARNILETGNPTGSGLGSVADQVAGFFGITLEGAGAADQLRVIGGALTGKVPRFEGPQSDADRLLYQEMAGQIGNDKISAERRLQALETVELLWSKPPGTSFNDYLISLGKNPADYTSQLGAREAPTGTPRSTLKMPERTTTSPQSILSEADAIIGI
ncbi:MAG: hypothetical protein GWN00_19765 [Aliifodinibius sp.]|nr:hypothetical protein [Fodinibius sp.]NIY26960.1 hypothetical protein [Fodinibius sp.]